MILSKLAHRIGAWVLIVGGVGHSSATFYFFNRPSEEAAWFLGGGIAILFSGLLNLAIARAATERLAARWLGHLTNAITILYVAFVLSQIPTAPQPYVLLSAATLQAVGLWGSTRPPRRN